MRLIDADALKEFINNGRVCDICPDKKLNCAIHCDFPDSLTPLWEKVIDNAPTIETDLSEYSDKLWQKAYERGRAEARKTGHWIEDSGTIACSECETHGVWIANNDFGLKPYFSNFCPNCGAKMTEEAENE